MRPSNGAAERLLADGLGAKRTRLPPRGRRYGPCAPSSRATCTPTIRLRRSTSPGGDSPSRRGPRPGCLARWPTRWSASNWTASLDGPWPVAPRRRLGRTPGSACCPISTPTASRVSPGIACTRARPTPARAHPGGRGTATGTSARPNSAASRSDSARASAQAPASAGPAYALLRARAATRRDWSASALSRSRSPRLARPAGVASRWLRQARPGARSHGIGAYQEDGAEQLSAQDHTRLISSWHSRTISRPTPGALRPPPSPRSRARLRRPATRRPTGCWQLARRTRAMAR